jgi:hypothetical protein
LAAKEAAMPWNESTIAEKKMLCKRFEISRKTGYKWLELRPDEVLTHD